MSFLMYLLELFTKPLLDVVILFAMAVIFGHPRYFRLMLGCVGVAAAFAIFHLTPSGILGDLFIVVLYFMAGAVLMSYGRVKFKRAALLAALFCLLHVIIRWIAGAIAG